MQKINYLDGYLYCSVSAEIFNEEYYSSYDEYFNDYEDDIKACINEINSKKTPVCSITISVGMRYLSRSATKNEE